MTKEEILDSIPHVRGTTEGDNSRVTMKLADLWRAMEEYREQPNPEAQKVLSIKGEIITDYIDPYPLDWGNEHTI